MANPAIIVVLVLVCAILALACFALICCVRRRRLRNRLLGDVEMGMAAAGAAGGDSGGGASARDRKKKWRVSVELGGTAFQVSVPMASAASAAELKQAIVEACLSNLGADVTPAGWLEGQTASMAVQFLDPQGSVHTLKPTTDFGLLRSSRTLRVTARAPKSTEAADPMED